MVYFQIQLRTTKSRYFIRVIRGNVNRWPLPIIPSLRDTLRNLSPVLFLRLLSIAFRFLTPLPFDGKSSIRPPEFIFHRLHDDSSRNILLGRWRHKGITVSTKRGTRSNEGSNMYICTYIYIYLLLDLSLASRRVTKENDKTFALLVIIAIAASIRVARSATTLLINFAISPSRRS